MKITCIGFGMAVALSGGMLAAPAYAQDARAGEVLAKTRKALGDRKLEALKTLTAQASMDRNVGSMQMSSEVELLVEMPDKYLRSEVPAGRMNRGMTTGFNGDKAILPGGGNLSVGAGGSTVFRLGPSGAVHDEGQKPTPEQLAQINAVSLRSARSEVSRMMLGWFGTAHPSLQAQYTYAGEAESPDGKAHVIDVRSADGFDARLFIDQNNHLPLMVTYKGRQPMMMTRGLSEEDRKKRQADGEKALAQQPVEQPLVDFTLFFDDWREVDGLVFPHRMRRALAGETTEEWTFTKVKVNPTIDPARFAIDTK